MLARRLSYQGNDAISLDKRAYIPNSVDDKWLSEVYTRAMWKVGDLSYKLHTPQLQARQDIKYFRTVEGVNRYICLWGRRGGKSAFIDTMAIEDCLEEEGVTSFVVGPSILQAWAIASAKIRQIGIDAPKGLIKPYRKDNLFEINSHSFIRVGSFDQIDSLRGMEGSNIYLEETREIPATEYDYVINHVLVPMLSHSGGFIVDATTPPEDSSHPFVEETIKEAKENGAISIMTIDDNPTLSQSARDRIINSCGGRYSIAARRELYVELDIRDDDRIIIPSFGGVTGNIKIGDKSGWLTSTDNATHKDFTVTLIGAYDRGSDILYVVDEVVHKTKTSNRKKIDDARTKEKIHCGGVTPARIIDCSHELLQELTGEYNYAAKKANNRDRDNSIQSVDDAFRHKRIKVHPRCTHLKEVLKGGRWNKSKTDLERNDKYGHADAIMSLVYLWKHRRDAACRPGVIVNSHKFAQFNETYQRSYLGVIWYRDSDQGAAISLTDTGRVISVTPLTGSSSDRLEGVSDVLENLNNPTLIYDPYLTSEYFRDELHLLGVPVVEIEDFGDARLSLFAELRDELESGRILIDPLNPIYPQYVAYKQADDNICFSGVDAFMLANHGRSRQVLRQRRAIRGDVLTPEDIGYYESFQSGPQTPQVVCLVETEKGYKYVKKGVTKSSSFWLGAGEVSSMEALIPVLQGVHYLYLPESLKSILRRFCIERGIYSIVMKTYNDSLDKMVLVDDFKKGREVFPDGESWVKDVVDELMLYPKEGEAFLKASYHLSYKTLYGI